MPRIDPLNEPPASGPVRRAWDHQVATNGRMTNMKRTLAHSEVALRALMEWYALRDEVIPFLGERRADLFSHAISAGTDCLICSTYFRRVLIDRGENPDAPALDGLDEIVIAFGRQLAADSNAVSDALYASLERHFTTPQIVTLTAFGALMVATNVLNNALRVDLDGYLEPYAKRSKGDTP